MPDDRKSPGSMSDADRALLHRRTSTPARGVQSADFASEDFTPVADVFERSVDLTDRERALLQLVWRHTANMELRARKRSDSSETDTLAKRIAELEHAMTDLVGTSGANGKLGALKERVDKAESRRWWATTFLAGLLVTVIGSAIAFGAWMGRLESDVDHLKQRRAHAPSLHSPTETSP